MSIERRKDISKFVPSIGEGFIFRKEPGFVLAYNRITGNMLQLNDSAMSVIEKCRQRWGIRKIITETVKDLEREEREKAIKEIVGFFQQALAVGLLTLELKDT